VYLAVSDREARPGGFGAGASPVATHAAERALSELVQSFALADTAAGPVLPNLARWPRLRDCALLPPRTLLSGPVRHRPLRPDPQAGTGVAGALSTLTSRLRGHDVDVYAAELAPPGSLVSVAAVVAPGLERFSLIRFGMPILPTGRGWPLWSAARRTRDAG